MNQKIVQIKKNLREARDASYLGRYQDSQKIFKKIVDSIEQELMLNNVDKRMIEEWRKFQAAIIAEKHIVQNIISMLNGMSFDKEPRHEISDLQQNRQTKNKFYPQDQARVTRNMSNHKFKPNTYKDPDVWDPPPIRQHGNKPKQYWDPVRQSNHKPPKYIQKNIPNKSTAFDGYNKQKKENKKQKKYDKPWLSNAQKPKQGEKKSTFLLDRYPDGQGPDANLINMLERQVIDFNPNVSFDDIAQLQTAKALLQQAVLLPLRMPQFFTGIRRAWKGVMMFGPPGTGKTLLAKAIASTGKTTFFNVSASSLASKWKGQSQKLVRILFEMAKFYAPTTIFFDQIDSLGSKRSDNDDQSSRKVKSQLLVQMDGANSNTSQGQIKYVMVLAATNRPWDLDQALRRRLQKRIYIPLPNKKGRQQLIKINLKDVAVAQSVDFEFIIQATDGYSGADITNLCRQAAYMPMRKRLKKQGGFKNIDNLIDFEKQVNTPLTIQDFKEALKNVNKSVGNDDLEKYQKWMKQFGSV